MTIEEAGSEEVEPSEFAGAAAEVAPVVEGLNQITRNKDYSRWLLCLDPSYRELLSCSSYLEQVSGKLPKALKERSVRLASIEDYFEHVFVPARKNARVDSIQFASPERAYAIMDLPENGQAAVYILQREERGTGSLQAKTTKTSGNFLPFALHLKGQNF